MAMAIFAIGFMAVVTMQTTSVLGNTSAYRKTDMTAIATARMETLLGFDYDDTVLDTGAQTLPVVNDGIDNNYNGLVDDATEAAMDTADPKVRVSWNVVENSPLENTKTVTVTIRYTDRAGNSREVQVQCNKADII